MKNEIITSEFFIGNQMTKIDSKIIILSGELLIFSNGDENEEIFDEIDSILEKKIIKSTGDVKFFAVKLEGDEADGDSVTIINESKRILIKTWVSSYISIKKIKNIFIYNDCLFLEINTDDLTLEEADILVGKIEAGLNNSLIAHEMTKDKESSARYVYIMNEDIDQLIIKCS